MDKKKEKEGVSYSRKPMIKGGTLYNAYAIFYNDAIGQREFAVVADESGEKAVNELEKAVVDGKGYEFMRGRLNPEVIDTGFKTTTKGLVFGFDEISNSYL